MSRPLLVHLLPELIRSCALEDSVAVVIDVLRASTTIVQALSAGAAEVIPTDEEHEAIHLAAKLPAGTVILGGERRGRKIPGFDLGNSPGDYTPERVRGKSVVFTSTNGTRAMFQARSARRVLVGAMTNRRALEGVILGEQGPVHLICAGTDRHVTLEDVLFAGLLAAGLCSARSFEPDDTARLALSVAFEHGQSHDSIVKALRASRGGENLRALGLDADIDEAARLDLHNIVPELHVELDVADWRISPVTPLTPDGV